MLIKVKQDPRTEPLMCELGDGRQVYLRRTIREDNGESAWHVKLVNPDNEPEHESLEFGLSHNALCQLFHMFGEILQQELKSHARV